MVRSFEIQSETIGSSSDPDLCGRLKATINIESRDRFSADAGWTLEHLINAETGQDVAFDALDGYDQMRIEKYADELTEENVDLAAQEYAEGMAWAEADRANDELIPTKKI